MVPNAAPAVPAAPAIPSTAPAVVPATVVTVEADFIKLPTPPTTVPNAPVTFPAIEIAGPAAATTAPIVRICFCSDSSSSLNFVIISATLSTISATTGAIFSPASIAVFFNRFIDFCNLAALVFCIVSNALFALPVEFVTSSIATLNSSKLSPKDNAAVNPLTLPKSSANTDIGLSAALDNSSICSANPSADFCIFFVVVSRSLFSLFNLDIAVVLSSYWRFKVFHAWEDFPALSSTARICSLRPAFAVSKLSISALFASIVSLFDCMDPLILSISSDNSLYFGSTFPNASDSSFIIPAKPLLCSAALSHWIPNASAAFAASLDGSIILFNAPRRAVVAWSVAKPLRVRIAISANNSSNETPAACAVGTN